MIDGLVSILIGGSIGAYCGARGDATPISHQAEQFGEPGLFSAPKLKVLYRTPSMST